MKSFKHFLNETDTSNTEVNAQSAQVNSTQQNVIANNVNALPPVWTPPPSIPPDIWQNWIDQWDRTHPMPEPREGESTEDYQRRLDEWNESFARHMRLMRRLYWKPIRDYLHPKRPSSRNRPSEPYYLEPDRPITDQDLDKERSWEFLRDLGIPGPWQDDWIGPDDII
jgi:hypothetical protein